MYPFLRDGRTARALLVALAVTSVLMAPVALDLAASPAAAATGCKPTATQVALFVGRSYGGSCVIFNVGAHSKVSLSGLPDNSVSSVKVGASVVAVVHQDVNFGGLDNHSWQSFVSSDVNLGDNWYSAFESRPDNKGFVEDSISALWVMRKGCLPGPTQVAVFQGISFGGACAVVGPGSFASSVLAGVPADFVGSLKVGVSTRVAVWGGSSFTGANCTYNARAIQATICLSTGQLSALAVGNDSTPPSLGVSHVTDGQNGWNVVAPVALSVVARDSGTGVLGAPTCKDNGRTISVSGSAPSFSANVPGDGTHTVTCSARDYLGNVANASDTVRVDNAAPSMSKTATVRGKTYPAGTWTNGDVLVAFKCSDAGSGVATVSPPVTVSAEGAAQSVTGTCTDKAGNSATQTFESIELDKSLPAITAQRSPEPGAGGWETNDVTVSFACDDALSGVATVTDPLTISSDGPDQSVTGTCTDQAGNRATVTIGDIDIDKNAPTVSVGATAGARPYQPGTWSKGDVVVTFNCSDAGSGVASVTPPVTVSSEGAGQSVTGSCTDHLGNSTTRTFDEIAIDKSAPSVSASATADGEPYPAGTWTDRDVTVSFGCDDALSGVASVSAPAIVTTEGPGQSASGSCTDRAGNAASTASTGINIDKNDPALSVSAKTGGTPYQAGAWTNQAVVVRFTCTDAGSGVASVTPPVTVGTEGGAQSVAGTCIDNLGKSASKTFADIAIDRTPPTVTYTGNAGAYTYGDPISIRCSASDALSGVAESACADITESSSTLGVGTHAFSASAVDRAGNSATASTTLSVDPRPVASVASGNWSDPAVWSNGEAPGPSDVVTVSAGHTVTLDAAAVAVLGVTIEQDAALVFAPDVTTTLESARNIVVEGRLAMRPASAAVAHVLRFVAIDERKFRGGGEVVLDSDIGLWVTGSGRLDAVGSPKTSWTRVAAPVAAGATSITLEEPPTGWQPGDQISIAPTEHPAVGAASWQGFDERTITGVSGTTVTFSAGTARPHPVVNGAWGAEVMNLTRNVRIEGTPSGRTHVMITATVPQTIANVALRYTGPRQDWDGNGFSEFVLGRYALHFHMGHDGTRGSVVEGVVVRDGGSHGFVPHMSHGITFRDTIAYSQFEDAYWWDEGQLTNDTLWDHTIAALVKSEPAFRGYRLTGFNLGRGTGNAVRDSVAVGVQGNVDASGFMWPEAANAEPNTWEFTGNVTHNNKVDGIFTWQNTHGAHVVGPLVAYHNRGFGIDHGAYGNVYRYRDGILFENWSGGIRQRAVSRGHVGQLTFAGMTVVGGAVAVELAEHNRNEVLPTVYRDCAFSGQTGSKITVAEGMNPGRYDFINCDLEPADFRIDSALPGMLIRVQRPDLTAFQIDDTGTATPIPRFDPPDIAPAVTLTSPATDATFTEPASVTITADAMDLDGTIQQVEFFAGTTSLGVVSASPYSFTWDEVAAGTYTLVAVATDNEGATTISSPVTITVDPP